MTNLFSYMANVGSYSINREPRTENREPRTENREPRTENSRARLKLLTPILLSLTFFAGECAQPTPKYIVTLNANGGIAGSTTTIEVESGKTATAPVSLPTRTSYVLLGWNTKEDGTGTAFVFGTTIVTADITIYAQWLGKPILTAKVVSSSQIDLSWTTSANATYYTLTDNGSEIATNINGTSYSHKDLVASSTHSYTVKACNTAGCSEASEAVSAKTDVVITVTELPKGIGHRYHYIAFSVTSSEPLTNYKMALKLSSEVAPTASELKSGLHITRNLSTKAHHNILYYTLNSNLLTKYPNATKSVILGKSTTDENADALLLSPGKSYKLYGLEEGTTTVKELKTFTTNTYTVGSIPFLADNYYGADGISVMDGYLYSKTVVQSVPTSRSIPNDRKYTFTHRNTDPPFMVFANQNRTGHYQWIYAIGDIGDNNIIHVVDVSFGHETKDLSKKQKTIISPSQFNDRTNPANPQLVVGMYDLNYTNTVREQKADTIRHLFVAISNYNFAYSTLTMSYSIEE